MQEFLPVVKATLLEWAQLALGNPLFAAALVLATALLASLVGMIRRVPLKRRAAASEKARAELADQLSMTQQQTAGLQERLVLRNQQISGTVQALAAGFDVGEQPVPAVSEDLVSEDLWQQHERIVTQLADSLRVERQAKAELQQSYQTEKERRAEKEAIIDNLQNTLAEKTLQITGLERQVAEILEKHSAQSARLTELERQRLEWDDTEKQRQQMAEKLAAMEAELGRLQKAVETRQGAEPAPAPIHPEPVAEAEQVLPEIHPEPVRAAASSLVEAIIPQAPAELVAFTPASLPAAAEAAVIPAPAAIEQAAGAPDQPQAIVLPDWDYQPEIAVPTKAEAQSASKGQAAGFAGKLKGLFGKSQPESKPESGAPVERAEATRYSAAEIPPETRPEPQPQPSAGSVQDPLGKMKGLLGLSRQKAAEAKAEPVESRAAEPAAPASPDAVESDSAKSQMKKIKNLFGMAKG
ncbi:MULTISPECIES: hypothetical protein [Methylomicrobium]|uniref:Uncharacterized protein n=1 Tax=Methylomicrobium album BG8 TaxID=686340 RepID=H8GMK9_METAL|nr:MULTISPECIES: hypothetical protein [Methylomicrobium]EIC28249.1 hypothetical protein Metal_0393 [Methylomicrobium album BG8]